jgi:8-oxo-dGTP pyrophosphatase MutT (NUDIX family)
VALRLLWRRNTARVLPVDPEGRVLLLHGRDLLRPRGRFWFTIGGAATRGETLRAAAVREMREEVGIAIDEALLREPVHEMFIENAVPGMRIVQEQTFYAVAVPAGVQVSLDGMGWLERSTVDKYAWLTPEELEADRLARTDRRLPDVLRCAVAAVRA